jgi:hypothetical protein
MICSWSIGSSCLMSSASSRETSCMPPRDTRLTCIDSYAIFRIDTFERLGACVVQPSMPGGASNSWRTRCSNSVGVGVISRLDGKVPAERSLQVGIRIYCSAVIRLLASEPPVDHEIDHFAQEVECG